VPPGRLPRPAGGPCVTVGERASKLVAANQDGRLPSSIIKPLWRLLKGIPPVLADGQVSWNEVTGIPVDVVVGHGDGSIASATLAHFATCAMAR